MFTLFKFGKLFLELKAENKKLKLDDPLKDDIIYNKNSDNLKSFEDLLVLGYMGYSDQFKKL